MGTLNLPGLIGLGLAAGIVGGMFGIGGGLIMVPGLILAFGLGQKEATGTSLFAQLLPVGLLGVREYWQRGEVNLGVGLSMVAGLFVGAAQATMTLGALSQFLDTHKASPNAKTVIDGYDQDDAALGELT